MKHSYFAAVIGGGLMAGFLAAGTGVLDLTPTPSSAATSSTQSAIAPLIKGDYLVAAPGRVEPVSEEIQIGAPLTGVLKQIAVHEGDQVTRGQVLARIDDSEYVAKLGRADADLQLAQAELTRVTNGALQADRDAAMAMVRQMEAVQKDADSVLDRQQHLRATGAVSQQALDQAQREDAIARQQRIIAQQKFAVVNDPAREEDVEIAQARVAAATAARNEAQAIVEQTIIRSPVAGTVLRIDRHLGEVLSVFVNQPIMIVGDLSTLNVRAEVDESDVANLAVDLPAYVTADAYGNKRFEGRVISVGQMLGDKNIRTDAPGERRDNKVLDVVIALDGANPLRPGLRVNAFISQPKLSALVPGE